MAPTPTARPTGPLVPLMLSLSVTTGLVDAISVLGLGKVFTANMTGNVVFLGFAAAGAPGFTFVPALTALAFFLIGAAIGGRTASHHRGAPMTRWLMVAATVEAVLLLAAAVLAIGYDPATLNPRSSLYAIIALTAVAMGFRNATVRELKVPDLTTTVLTLTLTGLAADAHPAAGSPNWGRRIAAVGCIFAGAALGGVMVLHLGLAVPLTVAAVLIVLSTAACVWRSK